MSSLTSALGPAQLSSEDLLAFQEAYYRDPVEFMQSVLGNWFTSKLSWVHRGWLAILLRRTDFLPKYGELDKIISHFVYKENPWDTAEKGKPLFQLEADGNLSLTVTKNTEIMMPRGIGKTTCFNGAIIFMAIYEVRHFVLLIGETATHASQQLQNIRREFEENSRLKAIYGNLKGTGTWNNDQIELANGFVLAATGRGGQVRGRNVNGHRPDLIALDDVEDEESVATAEQRQKTLEWFMSSVTPAIAELDPASGIFLSGTLLHNEALLVQVGRDPTFTTVVLGVLDNEGQPVFPSYMSLEKLEAKKAFYSRQGKLPHFYLEFFNRLVSEDTMKLNPAFVQREVLLRPLALALCHDPAISKKKKSDSATFAVVGLYPAGRFQVEDVWGAIGLTPQEARDKLFELHRKWHGYAAEVPLYCGIETVAYQEALYDLCTEKMAKEDYWFQLEKLKFNQEKGARILGQLEPRYKARVVHHRREFGELESQMMEFPAGHDDYLDVVAMCFSLLQPLYAAAAEKEVDREAAEGSYYKSEAGATGGL